MYQHYDNYNKPHEDYSITSPIYRSAETEERKFVEEAWPVDKEPLTTWINRTSIHEKELIEHIMYKHIFGGKRPWPSHTTSRYCPVCVLAQFVNVTKAVMEGFYELYPDQVNSTIIRVHKEPNNPMPSLSLESSLVGSRAQETTSDNV